MCLIFYAAFAYAAMLIRLVILTELLPPHYFEDADIFAFLIFKL